MKQHLLIASILAASAIAVAEPPKPTESTSAAAAFARLKNLVGEWESPNKSHITYELIANGTALVERDLIPNEPEMLTVYFLDGDRLLLTHYCMAGNQPRMQARRIDTASGEIDFDFLDATNLASPAAGHMHSAKFKLIDNGHYTSEWTFFDKGEKKFSESDTYTRVR